METVEVKPRISLKNILYATDFSPIADSAAPYALELARNHGAKVFALHVRPLEIYGMAPPESWPVLREASDEQARQQAAYLDRSFEEVNTKPWSKKATFGIVSRHIEQDHIDLIVVGTHGPGGVSRKFCSDRSPKRFFAALPAPCSPLVLAFILLRYAPAA